MTPETEVISCPACHHLLRVPLDWLGQSVQCPECRGTFRAPVRDGNGLTKPELLSQPAAPQPVHRKRIDALLLLPAFGLMLCGTAGLIVNGIFSYRFLADRDWSNQYLQARIAEFRASGFGADEPLEEREKLDAQRAHDWAKNLRWVLPAMGILSALAFLGGLSIALGWNMRLAQVGCVAASLNVSGLCCVPGAIAGIWGLLMLNSAEGHAHFKR
jgi:hypothetical protein